MQIGKKLYYEKLTGNIIAEVSERQGQGSVVETTLEQDFAMYLALQSYVPEQVGLIQLAYGQYGQDFASCYGYRINPATSEIIFNFIPPEASLPEAISAKIAELDKAYNNEILGGFYSNVKNGNRLYGMTTDDQLNLEALKNNVSLGLIAEGTLEYYAKGQPCEVWTNAEFMTLYQQAMNFKTERIKTCKAKKAQATAAITIAELELIVWKAYGTV